MNTTATSRRRLLAAAAALVGGSAANVIAIASSRAAGPPEADVELIELGRQFDELSTRQVDLDDQRDRLSQDPELLRLQGLADSAAVLRKTWPDGVLVWVGDRWTPSWRLVEQQNEAARRLAVQQVEDALRSQSECLGLDRLEERITETEAALDLVQRAIALTEAKSLRGVAVKARSAAFTCRHWFEESDEDADWDHLLARSVIRGVLALAGARPAV